MDIQEVKNNETVATVGEMVTEDYRKAEVFKKFGIDFCCGGKIPLDEICSKKGINVAEVKQALMELDEQQGQPTQDYNTWELDFLSDYIINTHHKYVNEALPLLDEFSAKVVRVHGDAHPEVIEIANHYQAVANELRMHMHKEEAILFPYIRQMAVAKRNNESLPPSTFGTVKAPINMMESEHDSAGKKLQAISELSNSYNPPVEACNTYRVLYAKLQEFEKDLHQHIHLENNILFPKAIKLETELPS
ncbi:MAG: iron-sulfur cluster repair di-iron protein [Bacteroidetes bacterium]|nr:iron-sulfur cluster repair di-iron protein [Bacteroidota bacterium]MCH8233908.1 iron-sulfur cluster repair di-iron protein [Bacteroidota bacterium]